MLLLILLYTFCVAHEAMGTFHTIYQCHQASFLACSHLIGLCCCKPHQEAFLMPVKELGILFNDLWHLNYPIVD